MLLSKVVKLKWNTKNRKHYESIGYIFTKYGEVESASVITFHSGKSKGFGFVTMPNDEQAKAAIDALNGTDLQGRQVIVNEARPKENGPKKHHPRGFKNQKQ